MNKMLINQDFIDRHELSSVQYKRANDVAHGIRRAMQLLFDAA